jgi:RES domain
LNRSGWPSGPLFRVGRDRDAWAVPDWAYAKEDGTFGNRFDDPTGVYRVLYASSQRVGCFIETLARFRVDVSFVADLALMENGEDDFTAFGTVRRAWLKGRCIGVQKSKANMRTFTPSNGSAT